MAAAATAESSVQPENKHYGIPKATFMEDVDEYMSGDRTAESVLKDLDEQHQKYKFMELNLLQKKKKLREQAPDIKKTLDTVKFLKTRKESDSTIESKFLLSDQVYAKATVPPTDNVHLWLGANVMLEYEIDDAIELLAKNLTSAEQSLAKMEEDLNFLRNQYTTVEVNMARIYNWDVRQRMDTGKASEKKVATSS
ncbi:Prefoldin subunit 3 [Trichoplax sp. H2]|nr:Prefoldin subunit 3 [Trichoplax sp. H2]|eukprot:RDD41075.1 Prefoldin subunit 3 [Trichoplax sp. H2]